MEPDENRDPEQIVDDAEERVLGRVTGERDDTDDVDPVEGDSNTGIDAEPAD